MWLSSYQTVSFIIVSPKVHIHKFIIKFLLIFIFVFSMHCYQLLPFLLSMEWCLWDTSIDSGWFQITYAKVSIKIHYKFMGNYTCAKNSYFAHGEQWKMVWNRTVFAFWCKRHICSYMNAVKSLTVALFHSLHLWCYA